MTKLTQLGPKAQTLAIFAFESTKKKALHPPTTDFTPRPAIGRPGVSGLRILQGGVFMNLNIGNSMYGTTDIAYGIWLDYEATSYRVSSVHNHKPTQIENKRCTKRCEPMMQKHLQNRIRI